MRKEKTAPPVDYDIIDEVKLKAGGEKHYGVVTFSSEGHFLIPGGFRLEIDEVRNEKKNFSGVGYEFLIRTPDGENGGPGVNGGNAPSCGTIQIIIHKLQNDVCLKSAGGKGGGGGDGKPGADGGHGGDGKGGDAKGGAGGDGGSGGNGGNGGDGAAGPQVEVGYAPVGDAQVIVLANDGTPCEKRLSYGGPGGQGGQGGTGGNGGQGGLNGDGKTRAPGGKRGKSGKRGNDGNSGSHTPVIIVKNDDPDA